MVNVYSFHRAVLAGCWAGLFFAYGSFRNIEHVTVDIGDDTKSIPSIVGGVMRSHSAVPLVHDHHLMGLSFVWQQVVFVTL